MRSKPPPVFSSHSRWKWNVFIGPSKLTTTLRLPVTIFVATLAAFIHLVDAVPLHPIRPPSTTHFEYIDQKNTNSPSSIIPNFQDLSAILSLLAADTVEQKFSNPSTPVWERMSAAWSVFGIMGLGRACIKIAAGLEGAEAAGFRLNGAGAFTSKHTQAAVSAWPIGSSCSGIWCDDKGQLLDHAYIPPGTWKKPIIVVHGYSQCPAHPGVRQFYREMWGLFLIALLTVALELGPLFLLWRYTPNNIGILTLVIGILGSFVGGCTLPIVLTSLNNMDVPRLADLAPFGPQSNVRSKLSQPGDLLLATPTQRIVKWKTESWRRSGDIMLVRILAGISLIAILGSYILNYLLLGLAPTHITYAWFGFQVSIMAGRYCLWARRPSVLHVRHRALVYTVMGRLCEPLPANPSHHTILPVEKGLTLSKGLIEFAVAAACSRLTNRNISTTMYNLDILLRLAGKAPRDILLARRCSLQDVPEELRKTYRVVRLPWEFIEELYLAQGLLLGPNPRSYAGLDVAIVFNRERFMGVTSVHPEATYPNRERDIVGRTADDIAVSGSLSDGRLESRGWMKLDHSMDFEHHRFWQNVDSCRNAAVVNGPTDVEIHAAYEGAKGGRAAWDHVHQRVRTVDAALELVRRICVTAARKKHDACEAHCTLYRLVPSTST